MKFTGHPSLGLLASLLLVAFFHKLTLIAVRAEEPRWFKLNDRPEVRAGFEIDASTETTTLGGNSATYNDLFLTPTIGSRLTGSIYHPNLLAFDLDGELGWGWDHTSASSTGSSQTRNESQELVRYLAQVNLLSPKPYNASFFIGQDHTHRDYGTFQTFTVDSKRFGGRLSWLQENWSVNADFGHREENIRGFNDASDLAEWYLNFLGLNRRASGQTTLTYRLTQFDNVYNGGGSFQSLSQVIGISDSEIFGARRHITATTGASFGISEYGTQQTETVTATENVSVHHNSKLDSFLWLDFAHNRLQPVTDTRIIGTVGLRHQLYESLATSADVHGSHQENSSPLANARTSRYGVGLFENYTKRLQSWGRLTLGAGGVLDHQDERSSGDVLTTIGEARQLYLPSSPSYSPVYLSRPRVVAASVQVDVGGDILVLGTDYQLITSGELTEVQLLEPVSSHLQSLLLGNDNLAVTVNYQSESLNNASYESLNASLQFRLDLFGRYGVYARLNWMDDTAPAEVLVQRLTAIVWGADYQWRWLRLGAEFEDYDSNFSAYQAVRFFQNADFRFADNSALNLSLNESRYTYADDRSQTQARFITRYTKQLARNWQWYVEGGLGWQEVLGTDQWQGSARTGFSWTRGRLSLRTGYEFNTQTSRNGAWSEERQRHRAYCYLKRTF